MPRGDRRLQQIERARDIDVDKGLRRKARDIGLVQRAGMDHRLDRMIGKDSLDDSAIRDRSDDTGRFSDNDIEADHAMAGCAQSWGEEAPEPAGGARKQDTHDQTSG